MDKITILRTEDPQFEQAFKTFLQRQTETAADVERLVKTVLDDVKEDGDASLIDYTFKYDRVSLTTDDLMVSGSEVADAYKKVDPQVIDDLTTAAGRIEDFHRRQLLQLPEHDSMNTALTEAIRPLQRVGLYVPGGKASYPSSVLMSAIPARVAGVKEITMVRADLERQRPRGHLDHETVRAGKAVVNYRSHLIGLDRGLVHRADTDIQGCPETQVHALDEC